MARSQEGRVILAPQSGRELDSVSRPLSRMHAEEDGLRDRGRTTSDRECLFPLEGDRKEFHQVDSHDVVRMGKHDMNPGLCKSFLRTTPLHSGFSVKRPRNRFCTAAAGVANYCRGSSRATKDCQDSGSDIRCTSASTRRLYSFKAFGA